MLNIADLIRSLNLPPWLLQLLPENPYLAAGCLVLLVVLPALVLRRLFAGMGGGARRGRGRRRSQQPRSRRETARRSRARRRYA